MAVKNSVIMTTGKNGFSDGDQLAIGYLVREIEWSRRAGRVLVGLIFALPLGLLVAVSRIDPEVSLSLSAAAVITSLTVLLAAGLGFWAYTRRIATQKRMLQKIVDDSKVSKMIGRHFREAVDAEKWNPPTKVALIVLVLTLFTTVLAFWLL